MIFLIALAVRLAYHQLVPAFDGSYDNGSDSEKYIWRALSILEHGQVIRTVDGQTYPDFGRMPLYPHFIAAIFWIVGEQSLAAITAVQAIISSFTVLAIGLIAGAFARRWAVPAALLASFWPAFVVYAAWALTDSLFVDFFTWGLCACVWASRDRRPAWLLVAAGFAFGLGLLTRPVLMFFPYLLAPVLVYLLVANHGMRWPRAFVHALVPAAIMLALLSPRLIATYMEYGLPVVTTQSGGHALELIYPCLRNDPDCDRATFNQRARELIRARRSELTEEERQNPLILGRIKRDIALDLMLEVPPHIFALSVADSAFRSAVQTMLYEVGDQLNLDPEYFSAVQGATFGERFVNFLAVVISEPFMIIWAVAQLAALLALPVQIVGLVACLRNPDQRPLMIFLVLTAAYFLAINLSFGNPKYGLPLNPAEIVLLVAGGHAILEWSRRRGFLGRARP
ncbi:MAG: glycosyltransferase family 39 protein [Proteobacteria bacterium]|nr:glycosyltransferase family 39 protein [Pseudomonadota bacterium]